MNWLRIFGTSSAVQQRSVRSAGRADLAAVARSYRRADLRGTGAEYRLALRSAIRGLTRLGILVEAVSKFLRELKRTHPELYAAASEEVIRRYVERKGNGCFADTRPSESKRRLPEAARDVHELLVQFRGTEAKDLESFRLLTCVFQEQCEIVEGREEPLRVREPNEIPCDSVMSPADPDVSYNARRGAGYLVQVMETFSEEDDPQLPNDGPALPDLITHVAVGKMTVHDRSALEPALEETAQRGVQPEDLLADSHYGSNECVQKAQAHGTQVISPAMPAKGKGQDRLTLEDFELDDEGRILRCPEGHVPLETSIAEVRLQVQLNLAVCAKCPQRQRCMAAAVGRRFSRYQYSHDRVRQRQRRLQETSETFRQRYRWRVGIEATISRLKHQLGMARLRVRGMAKVRYAAFLRALGLNILRVAVYNTATRAA